MKRKILAVVTVSLLVGAGAPGDGPVIQEVKQALNALNEAFEKGDAVAIKKLLTADHLAVTGYYGGPRKRDEQLDTLPQLKFTEYTPGEMKVTALGRDAALVTYPLTMKGTFQGRQVPRKNFASSVWVKRDGRWQESFYQETPLETK